MEKEFLNKYFEFGGTIQNIDNHKGIYQGVYIIVIPDNFGKVGFNEFSKLEKWKDKQVAIHIKELKNRWIENAKILYIGKSEINVQKRLLQHIKFWNGKNVSAYGGRIIGQIQNFENLEVWYLNCDTPEKTKKILLKTFKNQYGKFPFANLQS